MSCPFDFDRSGEFLGEAEGLGPDRDAMACKLSELPGLDPAALGRLAAIDVTTPRALIARCAKPADRAAAAKEAEIEVERLESWACLAELLRIRGVTPEYVRLLAAVGVGSIRELRERQADRLADAMLAIRAERNLARIPPSAVLAGGWIRQAGRVESVVVRTGDVPGAARETD